MDIQDEQDNILFIHVNFLYSRKLRFQVVLV